MAVSTETVCGPPCSFKIMPSVVNMLPVLSNCTLPRLQCWCDTVCHYDRIVCYLIWNGSTDVCINKVTPVKSIYLLNVVVNQEILIKTQKTKQVTSCRVARKSVPFITCYCTVWVKKSSPLKLFALFSLRLRIYPWNFASMLPVYIYTYLLILVDLS